MLQTTWKERSVEALSEKNLSPEGQKLLDILSAPLNRAFFAKSAASDLRNYWKDEEIYCSDLGIPTDKKVDYIRHVCAVVNTEDLISYLFLARRFAIEPFRLLPEEKSIIAGLLGQKCIATLGKNKLIKKRLSITKPLVYQRIHEYERIERGYWKYVKREKDEEARRLGQEISTYTGFLNMMRIEKLIERLIEESRTDPERAGGVWFVYAANLCTAYCIDSIRQYVDLLPGLSEEGVFGLGLAGNTSLRAVISFRWIGHRALSLQCAETVTKV